jgi:protein TonB
MTISLHERLLSALGAAVVVALLGYLLLLGLTVAMPQAGSETMAVLSFRTPLHHEAPVKPPVARSKHNRATGGQRPRGAASKAVAVAPPSKLPLLSIPSPAIVVPRAAPNLAPASGGGGQSGTGQGGSGEGNGTGDGDGDGDDSPPRLIRGRLKFSDLPEAMRAGGVGGTVSVRYEVEIDGKVGACATVTSSGNADLDRRTCQLIQQRFRFDPSRDRDGRPVPSMIEEDHSWEIDKPTDEDQRGPDRPS